MKKRPLFLIILVVMTTLILFTFPGSISANGYVPVTTYAHYSIISSPFNEPITIEKSYNNYMDALNAAKNMAHAAMYREDVQSKIATLTNEAFINYLYDGLFHRTPEEAGFAGWLGGLNNGLTRSYVIDYFINSPEFEMRYIYGYNDTAATVTAPLVVGGGSPLAVGDSYGGGKVAYIFVSGDTGYVEGEQHGLIAATADQSEGIAWITGGETQTTRNDHTLEAIGTGQANTNFMIAQAGYTGGAAKICDDYTITIGGVTYSDWFLPSEQELVKLYLNRVAIGGFAASPYWSSSEQLESNNSAFYINFSGGEQGYTNKSNSCKVRPIRNF